MFGLVEGFYLLLRDKSIFYVKGVSHPPNRVVAFPKYVPRSDGDRIHPSGLRYAKIPGVDNEMRFLLSNYPHYIAYDSFFCRPVPTVPLSDIETVLNPLEKAEEILLHRVIEDDVIRSVREFILLANEVGGVRNIGVSGSILANLHTHNSDIDIVVYGWRDSIKMYRFLQDAIGDKSLGFAKYSGNALQELYRERVSETPIPFEKFAEIESQRVLDGLFRGRRYFVRLVKEPGRDDTYGSYTCAKIGVATLKLRVEDDSDSIYTPCRYKVEVEEFIDGVRAYVEEVYSLRGRFNEIAKKGDTVVARGSVELLRYRDGSTKYRLYVGDAGDFIYPIKTL
ncbi:MAG: hypothetical protein QW348_05970 [Ignisphaera sp.]